uniref:Contactin 1 n=1 Tax=Neogobius melanostomus TaxID=47308 RepID=A0A8C6ULB6_9GOBI
SQRCTCHLSICQVAPKYNVIFNSVIYAAGSGPVFEEQPVNTIYPEESPEAKITMTCLALTDLIDTHTLVSLTLAGGNLVISYPHKGKHVGRYSCLASNKYGSVISRSASVQFGYLDFFSSEERESVYVKEGQGAVLLCAPPPHYPAELSFRWILNEFPTFIPLDKRRFVSQITGNLYISKVDASDSGNYSCIASSPAISKSVFSNYIPLVPLAERPIRKYPADFKVKFPDTTAMVGQNITLECFALGNPVPEIRWKKLDGPMPANHEVRMAGAHLHLNNVQIEDAGAYQCEALNSKGKDYHSARLSVEAVPEWVEYINNTEKGLGSEHAMSCEASGKPKPHIRWLKNGKPVNFSKNPVKRELAARNGRVVIECRPRAAPKPTISWSKDTELLHNSTRVFIWEDGSLEILNVTRADEGRYTCFAENDRGKANSTGSLLVTDATKITLAPANGDVKEGEDTALQCAASHDPSLDITFIWALEGQVIDLHKDSLHYERPLNGSSNGELLIRNVQLKHAGNYSCTAETLVDNVTASAYLLVRGAPGAPGGVRVLNKTEKSITVQWSKGADNHSPITKYTIQFRDAYSKVWKNASTSPAIVEGNSESATFRVIATNTLGTGEPSSPSPKDKTLDSFPVVAPSNVTGGGGTNGELIITWKPVEPLYYYGPNFGYILAFKQKLEQVWRYVTVSDPQARRYVHKDSSIPAKTEFQVKVKAFNSKGDGPYSTTAAIYSADDTPSKAPQIVSGKALSSSTAIFWWSPLNQSTIDGYEVRFWRPQRDPDERDHKVGVSYNENHTRLDGLKPDSHYYIEIRGYNSAGYGPPSDPLQIHTKRSPPKQVPRVTKKYNRQTVSISWECVKPQENEAPVDEYRVLYRKQGHSSGKLYNTKTLFIELPLRSDGNYVVEVRAHTEGGEGPVGQIEIQTRSLNFNSLSFTKRSLVLYVL